MRLHGIARATLLCVGVWLLQAAAQATTIGPDAFGYTATTEVPFSFVNIQPTGTQVLVNVDDGFVGAPIGFDFDFYGTTYNNLFISSNGNLTSGASNSQFGNTDFTTTTPSGKPPMIAPAWDDWVTSNPSDDASDLPAGGSRADIASSLGFRSSDHRSSPPSSIDRSNVGPKRDVFATTRSANLRRSCSVARLWCS